VLIDPWLPIGYRLPDDAKCRLPLFEDQGWQILETQGRGRALVVEADFAERWTHSRVLEAGVLRPFIFGGRRLVSLSSGPDQMLCPVSDSRSPNSKTEALAFAQALRATRAIDKESPLQDAIYVERFSRLLPTHGISSRTADDVVLGYWLTGGVPVSVTSVRRLEQMLSWMSPAQLTEVVTAAGLRVESAGTASGTAEQEGKSLPEGPRTAPRTSSMRDGSFRLPGRPGLEGFFNEHIVDIVRHGERYRALGIGFPSAIVLNGPPGCGKTFAVERLIDFLGWPVFQVEASSIASPYIHETSRKVAEVFDKAMKSAPSVVVIDEMDAFLVDRQMGSGHHRVEEMAEFLRRIPEAAKNEVLVIAMTNRIEMIDPAVLRRGRFDHVVRVDYASTAEVRSLLDSLLSNVPKEEDVDPSLLVNALAGRPLSDVAFVVREGARLAARSGKSQLDQQSLMKAMQSSPAREQADNSRRIGFL
jgi:cell division protease FtsH